MYGKSRGTRSIVVPLVSLTVALAGASGACGGHLGSRDVPPGVGGIGPSNEGGRGGAHGPGSGTGGTAADPTDAAAFGEPACPSFVRQGTVCTPADPQFCYSACGPEGTGIKWEACRSSGLYDEMVGCSYDRWRDFSCYRIPSVPDTACAAGTLGPQAGQPCDLPRCVPCNTRGGLADGEYFSAAGAVTVGWCVCAAPDANGKRAWSCATDSTWPCPLGSGC